MKPYKLSREDMRIKFFIPVFVLMLTAVALSACGTQAVPSTEVTSSQPTDLPAGSVQINGAGATFPLPVYTEWTYAYQYVDPSVVVNYQGIGSGGGKKGIVDGTIDFAGSDSLLKDEEYTAGVDLQMYPMLAGAVVNVYNITWAKEIPEGTTLPSLVLDRQTLVDIFNGTVNNWTDPAVVALNPGLDGYLPDATITVAHRSDGSGTTEIFTKALTAMSADWTAGGASSVEWPVDKAGNGVGGKGNQGVAAAVINTPNAIGYVELSYAVSNGMPFADMINKAGETVTASADSLASAMDEFAGAFDDRLNATIVDAPGVGSWPICGYTYLILHTTSMTDMVKAQKLLEYIQWTLTDASAAKRAGDLGYSVLPASVRDLVMAKLAEVTVNGETVLK
jgi:phosphate transport system substrate-binding protein